VQFAVLENRDAPGIRIRDVGTRRGACHGAGQPTRRARERAHARTIRVQHEHGVGHDVGNEQFPGRADGDRMRRTQRGACDGGGERRVEFPSRQDAQQARRVIADDQQPRLLVHRHGAGCAQWMCEVRLQLRKGEMLQAIVAGIGYPQAGDIHGESAWRREVSRRIQRVIGGTR